MHSTEISYATEVRVNNLTERKVRNLWPRLIDSHRLFALREIVFPMKAIETSSQYQVAIYYSWGIFLASPIHSFQIQTPAAFIPFQPHFSPNIFRLF